MSDEPNPNTDNMKPALIIGGAWVIALAAVWMFLLQFKEGWDLGIFFGRFHILVVHAPIGLLLAALVMELCRGFKPLRSFSKGVAAVLWLGALGAGASVILGLILMVSEEVTGGGMDRHKWSGIAVAVLAFVSLAMKLADAKRGLYLAVLTITVFLTGYAGHMGGMLVHEDDFFSEHAPKPLKPLFGETEDEEKEDIVDIGALLFYAEVIQPIFDEKCVECHGAEKVKGKLRMDSFEELAKGGDIGESFVAGDVEASELHYRVADCEPGDDDFMPPGKDDVPMTPEEIALMDLWIEKGASPTMTVAEAAPTENLLAVIEAIAKGEEGPVEEPIIAWAELTPEEQKERLAQVQAAAEEIGFSIMPLSAEDDRLRLNVINCASEFGDEQLALLKPIESHLAWVDLKNSKITDAGMKQIGRMLELERLHLENTEITDGGLSHLTRLAKLNYLNLYNTKVSDDGLGALYGLRSLRKLYLWQTDVTIDGKRDFERAVNLEINIGSEMEQPAAAEEPAEEGEAQNNQ